MDADTRHQSRRNTPNDKLANLTPGAGISWLVPWACLAASALSTVLFFVGVTMFFIFPAMNVIAISFVLVASKSDWINPASTRQQSFTVVVSGVLSFFLLVLPWLQMIANIELSVYNELAWWFERALQGVL